jgi:hypothetical protein
LPALQLRRQIEGTEAGAHEAAHRDAGGGKHPAHEPVASFTHPHPVPAVAALSPLRFQQLEPRGSVLELDPAAHSGYLLLAELADDPHGVIAHLLKTRMREPVGELARVGEHEQAAGVEIEPADREPAATLDDRDSVEHARTPLGIALGDDLSLRLVVEHHARLPRSPLGMPLQQG